MAGTVDWLVELVKITGLLVIVAIGFTILLNLCKTWFN